LTRQEPWRFTTRNGIDSGSEARQGIGNWFDLYNRRRPHSSLGDRTPMEVYLQKVAA